MKYKNKHKHVILFDRENCTLVTAINDKTKAEFEALGWRVECSCKSKKSLAKKTAKIIAKIEAEKKELQMLELEIKLAILEVQRDSIDNEIKEVQASLTELKEEAEEPEIEIFEIDVNELIALGFLFAILES